MLLDGALVMALLGPCYRLIARFGSMPGLTLVALLVSLVACIGLWVAWRRGASGRRAIAPLFAAAATACSILTDGSLGFGMVWVAVLVLTGTFDFRAAAVYVLALIGILVGGHLLMGASAQRVIEEVVVFALLAGFGGAFALLIDRSERTERALRKARAEQDATLERLAATNAELRARAGTEQDLVLARERERSAQGLHDVLGHRLTAIGLSLEFAERARDIEPERAWREVARARETAGEALSETRRIVRAMNPVELRTLRGVEAFEAIAEAFRSSGIDVHVSVGGTREELPEAPLLLLVRFVQEGLTNVVRHSDAVHAVIDIDVRPDRVIAALADDGSTAARDFREGFGLRSLRIRAESMGGTFASGPGESGFELRLTLPTRSADVAGPGGRWSGAHA